MSFKTKRNRTVAEGLCRVRGLTSATVVVTITTATTFTLAAATTPATTATTTDQTFMIFSQSAKATLTGRIM